MPAAACLTEPLYALVQGSYDRALAPLRALQWRIAAIGAAGSLCLRSHRCRIARGITSPPAGAVSGMREVRTGEPAYRSPIEREDEIGFLARSFNEMVAGLEERERIKDTFGRFVSRDVAEAVLGGHCRSRASGATSPFFSRTFAGSPSLSEHSIRRRCSAAQPVFHRSRRCGRGRRRRGQAVHRRRRHGAVRRAAGTRGPPGAGRARGARHRRAAARLNASSGARTCGARIGIGIVSGEVVAGLIGPDNRVEYGVVGDPVNLANRVESLTQGAVATVLVSRRIADGLGAGFVRGRASTLPVKGRREPVEVVEILDCARA